MKNGFLIQNNIIVKRPKPYKKPLQKNNFIEFCLFKNNKFFQKSGKITNPSGKIKKGGKRRAVKIPRNKKLNKNNYLTFLTSIVCIFLSEALIILIFNMSFISKTSLFFGILLILENINPPRVSISESDSLMLFI